MKLVKAFKYRLKTNKEIEKKFNNFSGSTRFIWNKFLALNLERLANKSKIFWYNEMSFWLTLYKSSEEYSFLKECPSQILQQKLKDLDKAFKDAFDKKQPGKRMVKWRSKKLHNSFRFPSSFKIENNRIFLPKLGWVNFFNSRKITGTPKNITISKSGRFWYVSIQTETLVEEPKHNSDKIVAIDLGVAAFASLSSGEQIKSPKSFKNKEKKLKRYQRILAKKREVQIIERST
jgi:putative transposase